MRRFWLSVWMVLLLLHLVTLALARLRGREPRAGGQPIGSGLIELAAETNAAWERLAFADAAAEPGPVPADPGEELLRCQALLLRLREAEGALLAAGGEVRIADDLQAWLARGAANPNAGSYLQRVLDWMAVFGRPESPCLLRRLQVQPDPASDYPVLAFELAGQPSAIARGLREATGAGAGWLLLDLDLTLPQASGQGWMLGSCRLQTGPVL